MQVAIWAAIELISSKFSIGAYGRQFDFAIVNTSHIQWPFLQSPGCKYSAGNASRVPCILQGDGMRLSEKTRSYHAPTIIGLTTAKAFNIWRRRI